MSSDLALRIASHFTELFRRSGEESPKAEFDRGEGWIRVVTRTMHPFGNFVVANPKIDASTLESASQLLAGLTEPSCVIFEGLTEDKEQGRALRGLGFEPFSPMPMMAAPVQHVPDSVVPEGFEFREIGESEYAAWAEGLAAGYEIPLLLSELFTDLADGNPEVSLFGMFDDDQVVSTSMSFAYDGLFGIYGVSTRPEYRGKGLGAYVTAEPIRRARHEGWDTAILQSSDAGFPIYQKLGFEQVGAMTMYLRMPGV